MNRRVFVVKSVTSIEKHFDGLPLPAGKVL